MTRKKRPAKISTPVYTKGELNRLVDSLVHPLLRKKRSFRILDLLAHAVIERDVEETTIKFVRYTLPEIIRELLEALGE